MPKPYPCLWFNGNGEEAAEFYTNVFPDSRIDKVLRAAANNPSGTKGDVLTVDFTLEGQRFGSRSQRARDERDASNGQARRR